MRKFLINLCYKLLEYLGAEEDPKIGHLKATLGETEDRLTWALDRIEPPLPTAVIAAIGPDEIIEPEEPEKVYTLAQ